MNKKLAIKKHFTCNKKNVVLWIFSSFAAILLVLTKVIYHIAKTREDSLFALPLRIFTIENLLILVFGLILFKFLTTLLYDKLLKRKKPSKLFTSSKKVFWATFATALVVWGICFLTYFPGLAMNDTLLGAMNFVDNSMHPPFFLAVIYFFTNVLGGLFNSTIVGFGLLTATQIILEAFIVAFFVRWLQQKRVSKLFICLSTLFLICFPIIICYSNAVLKDTWFAFGILLLLPNLYDFVFSKKTPKLTGLLLFLSLALIVLSRSNGIIIAAIILLILFIIKIKNSKKILIFVTAGVCLVFGGFTMLTKMRNIPSVGLRESISIPLDQVGATFYYSGNMSDEEKDFFTQILPEQKWKDNFRFSFIDKIKFNPAFNETFLNENKAEFFSKWSQVAIKNPIIASKAFLYQTFGVWNISFWDSALYKDNQSTFYSLANNVELDDQNDGITKWLQANNLHNQKLVSGDIYAITTGFYSWSFEASMLISPGLIILFLILVCCYLIINKNYKMLVVSLPLFLGWGSMLIATPASLLYRYYFFLLLAIPFIAYVLLYQLKKNS